jgi:NodT family efflux transporter outer membrane factor (OMF) lipoprotein
MYEIKKENCDKTVKYPFICIGLILLSFIFLISCAVGPNFKAPVIAKTDAYVDSILPPETVESKGNGGKIQHFAKGEDIPGEWWNLFHSKALNELIVSGIKNSPSLEAAQAALRQSQENMQSFIGMAFFPAVDGQASGSRQRALNKIIDPTNTNTSIYNLYNASINVSYTLDIFGGSRRQMEALCANVEYQRFLLEAAYLSLTSNIVTTAITEASLRAQIKATNDLIQLSEKELNIIKKQFELGGVSKADILFQEAQLADLKAMIYPLEKNLAFTRHFLSVLIGELPSENKLHQFNLTDLQLPQSLPLSMPSLLVQQRPDVRAAKALLHQASAKIGVATANLLPQFTLTGSYGTESFQMGNLFTGSSAVWSHGAQILQPIFHGGALRAQKRAALAGYDQAAAQYRQAVLLAFQNVADSLRALEIDAKTLKAQSESEMAAKTSLDLIRQQYHLGATDYLSLLTAESQYQQAKIKRIQAQSNRYADTAALFQALGGGWWNRSERLKIYDCQ